MWRLQLFDVIGLVVAEAKWTKNWCPNLVFVRQARGNSFVMALSSSDRFALTSEQRDDEAPVAMAVPTRVRGDCIFQTAK